MKIRLTPATTRTVQISFHEWNNSALARSRIAALGENEVQVWTATASADNTGLELLARALSRDECARAERFSAGGPRRQFVFGRGLLRQILGAGLDVEPALLEFGYQPRGKPFLLQPGLAGNLNFNLSHSGKIAAIALARGREVGVDVEMILRLDDWLPLAGRIFSPRELCELQSLPKSQQQAAFFNGWTRKEAWLKATGEGLTDALQQIEVTVTPGQEPELLGLPAGPEIARQWEIRAVPLPPDFAGAVVFQKNSTVRRELFDVPPSRA